MVKVMNVNVITAKRSTEFCFASSILKAAPTKKKLSILRYRSFCFSLQYNFLVFAIFWEPVEKKLYCN
ncbi:hypothetical protein DERP_008544 [Dermatophagoides pteronyssinus]|uniref:Uncharacterized protein n=1 Tax=Dermatophagoides pteronyssinus TaxID=6956 RepID=A0ABQ8IWM3_DERPT|nr:hypothetical protein DERP_008544 [Dermatophagoides pteronyssinus]